MKKYFLISILVVTMVFSVFTTVMGQGGYINLGYESLGNEVKAEYSDDGLDAEAAFNTSQKMVFIEGGYQFENRLGLAGKYGWYSEDQGSFQLSMLDTTLKENLDVDLETWRAELSYTFPLINNRLQLTALVGSGSLARDFDGFIKETEYETEEPQAVARDYEIYEMTLSGSLNTVFSGLYIGGIAEYEATENLVIGGSLRYYVNPEADIDFKGSISGSYGEGGSELDSFKTDLDTDVECFYQMELYGKVKLADDWYLKAAYSKTFVEYKLKDLNVELESQYDGLAVTVGYKF